MKILRRKPASIANGRWAAYATAGVASAFTCANSAEATIHYSGPINRIFNGCLETATFRLDRAGDFIRLRHSSLVCSSRGYSGSGFFNVGGLAGASIAGFYNECPFNPVSASNLERGQLISHRPVVPAQTQSAVLAGEGSICNGQFAGRGIGYIGFKFNNGSGDQFGWARIQTQAAISHHFILRDYAYGDVGDRIRAGQKSSKEMVPEEGSLDEQAPDEGSLGWLALGAAGLLAWRKSRSRKTLTFLVS
jgi:MYXO-CTERM domain-containing protein